MSEHTLHYGDISWTMPVADKNLAAVLESNPVSLPVMEPDQAVREALRHPIGSPCLKDIVNPGEKICLLVPDVTRLWQSPAVYVHVMVEELNACGIPDSDILIVTATGTHRAHMGDEQARLLGEDICRRIRVIDHDCRDTAHLVHVGDTSRGTPVWFNSYAMACDKIIITCGVVYHFLAGFGGGGKMLHRRLRDHPASSQAGPEPRFRQRHQRQRAQRQHGGYQHFPCRHLRGRGHGPALLRPQCGGQ